MSKLVEVSDEDFQQWLLDASTRDLRRALARLRTRCECRDATEELKRELCKRDEEVV
jgi:hypothetical protein